PIMLATIYVGRVTRVDCMAALGGNGVHSRSLRFKGAGLDFSQTFSISIAPHSSPEAPQWNT
ncbi:MAG: hypothetical protein DMG52_00590, partial [Acidobacteria bacterium]